MNRRQHSKVASWHLGLMLVLTFSTGLIDAIGFLGLDRVFTANMTGNVVILGMALAGAQNLPILGPAVALGAFMLGAGAGGRAMRRRGTNDWSASTTVCLGIVGFLVLTMGIALMLVESPRGEMLLAAAGTLAAAMGLQASVARNLGVKDVTTVVITSTITGLAAELQLGKNQGNGRRRSSVILLMLLGAVLGSALHPIHPAIGLLVAAALISLTAFLGHIYGTERPCVEAHNEQSKAHIAL